MCEEQGSDPGQAWDWAVKARNTVTSARRVILKLLLGSGLGFNFLLAMSGKLEKLGRLLMASMVCEGWK